MYAQENQKATHLMILICTTVFTAGLALRSAVLGWEPSAVILLCLGLAAGWFMHITAKITVRIRLWTYTVLLMLAFFFYGIHEVSFFDLAPLMAVFIFLYTATEQKIFPRLWTAVYCLTVVYDLLLVVDDLSKTSSEEAARLVLHLAMVVIAERISETLIRRHKAEKAETEEKIRRLEEANRSAEDFLANVSHELRTPINAVTGISGIMLKNEEDPEKKKDLLSIQVAGSRLFGRIADILDYTEIDADSISVAAENYTIPSIINDIIVENRMLYRDNPLEFVYDVDAAMPSVLQGDGRKIKRIIKHLIDNAVKFTRLGGVYIRVYALRKPYGINLCINVSDTGVGIAEEELGKIKDKFFQSGSGRSRKTGGLGLGLTIVHGMVTAMEGFMQIESTVGMGTAVSVSIPQKVIDSAAGMQVTDRSALCVGLYLIPDKYKVPQIRNYYNTAITHMVRGLDLPVHRIFAREELKKLVNMYRLTHLVIGREEYGEDPDCYEQLDRSIDVVVVAEEDFTPAEDSRVKIIRKPFYCLSVVNVLNARDYSQEAIYDERDLICPGIRVLVVDDEPMNLIVAEGLLKAYQMEVKTAESGAEAIKLCKSEEFDLIFLDHMMPEMDGVETLNRLRRIIRDEGKFNCPIVAFSANVVSGAREMFLHNGFDDFISKPVEEQELKRLLRKVLPKSAIIYAGESGGNDPSANGRGENKGKSASAAGIADGLDRLKKLGFDTAAGLRYSGNDSHFYKNLLVMFAKTSQRKIFNIESALKADDMSSYRTLTHALKSSSKMIGADKLSELAKVLEEAAKNGDAAYIYKNTTPLLEKFHEAAQQIADIFISDEQTASEQPAAEEISQSRLLEKLKELKSGLDTYEADKAEAVISEISGFSYRGSSLSRLLRDIAREVDNFDFNAADEKLQILTESVERGEAQ